jgi:hypothetical protein
VLGFLAFRVNRAAKRAQRSVSGGNWGWRCLNGDTERQTTVSVGQSSSSHGRVPGELALRVRVCEDTAD